MNKLSLSHSLLKSLALASVFCFILTGNAGAKPQTQLVNNITLNMYVLVSSGAIAIPIQSCNTNDTTRRSYGCTFFPGDAARQYPFNSNSITIGMESHMLNGVQQGYVHNVISQEMLEGSPLASYTAQAIASRTYAYYQSNNGTVAINNSGSGGGGLIAYQVYLPFRFDGLGGNLGPAIKAARQATVNDAVTQPGPLYMTPSSVNTPIFASFGADNCSFTQDGFVGGLPAFYLKSIYDPISIKPAETDPDPTTVCRNSDPSNGTPNGGMGSNGASRWGFGNTSALNSGNPWVRWDSAFQILTHYYTNIQVRNASGQVVTPRYRWVPLSTNWSGNANPPSAMMPGTFYSVQIVYQNTEETNTNSNSRFAYQWKRSDGTVVVEGLGVIRYDPYPGGYDGPFTVDILTPISPSRYTLMIDRQTEGGQYVHNLEPGKPWYTLNYQICVSSSGQCNELFMPIILKE